MGCNLNNLFWNKTAFMVFTIGFEEENNCISVIGDQHFIKFYSFIYF